jgi:hypothetical protein
LYAAQATFIRKPHRGDRSTEKMEQVRWAVSPDVPVARIFEEVVARLANEPVEEGEEYRLRDITLMQLFMSSHSVGECKGGAILHPDAMVETFGTPLRG